MVLRSRRFRQQAAAPQRDPRMMARRVTGPIANEVNRMRGVGPGLSGMANHEAVRFGQEMTRNPSQGAIDLIRGDVGARLGEKGIYQDSTGTWQIKGMERPLDMGIQMRNAAVAAMDPTGVMMERVLGADERLNMNPFPTSRVGQIGGSGRTSTPGASPVSPLPSPGLGGGFPESVPLRTATPAPTPTPAPTTSGDPGYGRNIPTASQPGIPGPAARPDPLTTPGHQQTGRATPLGASAQAPGSSGDWQAPGARNTNPPPPTGSVPVGAPDPNWTGSGGWAVPTLNVPGGDAAQTTPSDGGWQAINRSPQAPERSTAHVPVAAPDPNWTGSGGWAVPDTVGGTSAQGFGMPNQGALNQNAGDSVYGRNIGTQPAQQMSQPGGAQRQVTPPVQTGEMPASSPTNQPGHQQTGRAIEPRQTVTPVTPGPATTPQVPAPGPGRSTSGRPVDNLPTGFGSPGPTVVPQNQPRTDLSNLGNSIADIVQSRIAGTTPAISPASPGSPTDMGLQGLGDRIRASVQGSRGDIATGAPGGGMDLSGLGASIMDRVRGQLSQRNVGQQTTVTPGPQTAGPAPGNPGAPAPGPGAPVPSSTAPSNPGQPTPSGAGTLGSYGNASIDQWDAAFIAASQKYPLVDPTLLKAMMEIESGGDGNLPLDWCRSDGSCGPMQIKPEYWGKSATVEDQIMLAAKILSDGVTSGQYATAEDALFGIYFPTDDVMNGTTQGGYRDKVRQLQQQMGPYNPQAAPPQTTPVQTTVPQPGLGGVPTPIDTKIANQTTPPAPGADQTAPVGPTNGPRQQITSGIVYEQAAGDGMGIVASPESDESYLNLIGQGTQVSTDYKQPVTWEVPALGDCPYCYQNGHGADGTTHAAMDIVTPGGYGAPVGSPMEGRVVCAGHGQGSSVPGWNCNYAIGCTFEDSCGAGQITLDVGTDGYGNQLLVNMIHLGGSSVQDGQIVTAGQQIGAQGSMGGMIHTHMEALVICNGNYIYLDPTLVANGFYNGKDACQGY